MIWSTLAAMLEHFPCVCPPHPSLRCSSRDLRRVGRIAARPFLEIAAVSLGLWLLLFTFSD
jgi:hypothetical protein